MVKKIVMKKLFLMSMVISSFLVASIFASDPAQSIRENVFFGMHQIKLPDGLTIFGETDAAIGTPFSDAKLSFPEDCNTSFTRLTDFTNRLIDPRLPESKGWFSLSTSYYSPKELLDIYKHLVDAASRYNNDALKFFEILLKSGQFSGVTIPGLTPQLGRAETFRKLYEWRRGLVADATHALEAIRIEREPIDAIAAEEAAKRKAAVDARAEYTRIKAAPAVRHHHTHESDDEPASVKGSLLHLRKPKVQ